jgi:hypothetical protein
MQAASGLAAMKAKIFALAVPLDVLIAVATKEMAQMTDDELCADPIENTNLAEHMAAIFELRRRIASRKPRYSKKLQRRLRLWDGDWQPGWGKVLTRRMTFLPFVV